LFAERTTTIDFPFQEMLAMIRCQCLHSVLIALLLLVATLAPPATAANVMFVLRDELTLSEGDEAQIALFQERGDTLDFWDNGRLQAEAADALDVADAADLVYIDESVGSGNTVVLVETVTPVLNNEQFAFDNWWLTDTTVAHGSPNGVLVGGSHFGSEIQIVNENHPIAKRAGVTNGIVKIYDDVGGRIDWGTPAPSADIVALVPGFDQFDPAAAIFVYEAGAELVDGSAAPGMRIGFFLSDTNKGPDDAAADGGGPGWEATLLTPTGKALLSAAIDYGLGLADARPKLQAGDADMDLDFDQLDLVRVQISAKYLSGQPATWGDGDWNGAPGGEPGNPPPGDARFDQLDIIGALAHGLYLIGPYAAINSGGTRGDGQTSIVYNPGTGELAVDAPAGIQLTSVNIDSAAGIFTGTPAQNLGGSFDNDADNNIFKATFGSSFGSLSFGNVAQAGLPEAFLVSDLTVVGSLAGGGNLGPVDLIYVPEPSSLVMLLVALGMLLRRTD
jgi:hypothetical protein